MSAVALDAIVKAADLVAYGERDLGRLKSWMLRLKARKRDLALSERAGKDHDMQYWLDAGAIVFRSDFLDTDILLVKADAGARLLGGRKARYLSYLGSYEADEWMIGNVFGSLAKALAGIGNLYRVAGAA